MTKTRVPAIPAPTEANLREVARALKVLADIREGVTGDPLDRFVTFRDLDDGGVASVSLSGGRVSGIRPSAPIAGPGYDPTADLTTPPQPTGVTATGAFASVILSWDGPPAGYINHAYAEIWRADTNVIGESILIGTTSSTRFVDFIGNSATRYYWVRFVSQANVIGAYHGISGAVGTTAEDPELLLDALTGQITENQLYQDLGARINLIDGSGVGSVNARIADESYARSLADATLTSAVQAEEAARSLADGITGAALAAAGMQAGQTAAALIAESSTRIDGDVAVATIASGAVAQAAGAVAAITLEQQARTAADEASAQQVASLASALGDGAAALQFEQSTRVAADSALSEQALTLAARTADTAAGLRVTQQVQADSSSALASQTMGLVAAMGENAAGLRVEQLSRADADQTAASQLLTLSALTAQGASTVAQEQQARADQDSALAAQTTTLAAAFGENAAGLRTEQQARADADQAVASRADTLAAAAGQTSAALQTVSTTQASADSALASQVTTLQSTVGGNTVAIETEALTRASETGGLSAKYSIKIDNAGHISGYGLASTANDATPTSEFGVRADKFWIAGASTASNTAPSTGLFKGRVWLDTGVNPAVTKYWTGSDWSTSPQTLPFSVLAAPGTINGVSVPAGVYIDTAFIGNATIKSAQIGSVAADTIQAGYTSSVDLESSTFFGSQLYIGGTATYEFNDPTDNTRKTGIASVANPDIALSSDGAEFNVGFFKIKNGASSVAPFEVVDNTIRIKTATIGDGTITNAKIGNAQIGTLKLAENAVSVAAFFVGNTGALSFLPIEYCSSGFILLPPGFSITVSVRFYTELRFDATYRCWVTGSIHLYKNVIDVDPPTQWTELAKDDIEMLRTQATGSTDTIFKSTLPIVNIRTYTVDNNTTNYLAIRGGIQAAYLAGQSNTNISIRYSYGEIFGVFR